MSDIVKSELKKAIDNLNHDLDSIGLENLSEEDLARLSKTIIFEDLKEELKMRAKVDRVNIEDVKNDFITSNTINGKHRPASTQRAYRNSLNEFFTHCEKRGVHPLMLSRRDGESFINSLSGSIKTVNSKLSYLKSFYEYLLSYDYISKNPMRSIKTLKPSALESKASIENKRNRIPTEDDIKVLLDSFMDQPTYCDSILMMAFRGLRVSALEDLAIKDNVFKTISKGKYIEGSLDEALIDLSSIKKFYPNKNTFLSTFNRRMKKLVKEGKISNQFSVHDLRHYFAINHYLLHKDIYRTSKALNHASIGVTQNYLRGLNLLTT